MSAQSDLTHKSKSCVSGVRLSVILISSLDSVQGHNSAGCLYSQDPSVSSLSKLNQNQVLIRAGPGRRAERSQRVCLYNLTLFLQVIAQQ